MSPASRSISPPDQAQAGRPWVDQRVLESGLTSRENASSELLREFWHGTRPARVTSRWSVNLARNRAVGGTGESVDR